MVSRRGGLPGTHQDLNRPALKQGAHHVFRFPRELTLSVHKQSGVWFIG
jgi:hypothetical protein